MTEFNPQKNILSNRKSNSNVSFAQMQDLRSQYVHDYEMEST